MILENIMLAQINMKGKKTSQPTDIFPSGPKERRLHTILRLVAITPRATALNYAETEPRDGDIPLDCDLM